MVECSFMNQVVVRLSPVAVILHYFEFQLKLDSSWQYHNTQRGCKWNEEKLGSVGVNIVDGKLKPYSVAFKSHEPEISKPWINLKQNRQRFEMQASLSFYGKSMLECYGFGNHIFWDNYHS